MTFATANSPAHQQTVRDRKLQGYVGGRYSDLDALERNYVNIDPQAVQVSTLTVDTYTGSADYVFSFNGVEYTMTEDGTGANTTDVAEQLVAFMENEGAIYGHATVESAINVVTITGRNPGATFTLTDSDAKLTSATTTSAADADEVEFGRALARGGYATGAVLNVEDSIESAAKVEASYFTAQVDTWTLADPGIGQFIKAWIKIRGLDAEIEEQVPWDTNLDTTLDNLATVLNAALTDMSYNAYVTVAGPGGAPGAGELEFTAAIAGVEFTTMVTVDDAAAYPAITVSSNKDLTHGSGRTSLAASFAGVALRVSDQEAAYDLTARTEGKYAARSTMLVAERGEVWVQNSQTIIAGQQVFVDTAATTGLFYNAAAAGRIPLPRERAEWIKGGRTIDNENIAALRLK